MLGVSSQSLHGYFDILYRDYNGQQLKVMVVIICSKVIRVREYNVYGLEDIGVKG